MLSKPLETLTCSNLVWIVIFPTYPHQMHFLTITLTTYITNSSASYRANITKNNIVQYFSSSVRKFSRIQCHTKGLTSHSNSVHFSLFPINFCLSFLALGLSFELRFSLIQWTFGFPSDIFQTVELWDLTSNTAQCLKLMKSVLKWRSRQNN